MLDRIHKITVTIVAIFAAVGLCFVTVKTVRFIERLHKLVDTTETKIESVAEKFGGLTDRVSGVVERFEKRKLFEPLPVEVEPEP